MTAPKDPNGERPSVEPRTERPITIASFEAGARAARGTAVVIDVFRAFTAAAVAFSRGAEEIVMVEDLETALSLRAAGRGDFCFGERLGERPPAFDWGNSPRDIAQQDLSGARLIQTTSNGTRGVLAAIDAGAQRVLTGALVNLEATCRLLCTEAGADAISLVAMGHREIARADEDELCALALRARLLGQPVDGAALVRLLRSMTGAGGRSLIRESISVQDIEACLALDSIDFAIEVRRENGLAVARIAQS
jgi:2-phosphosulfolactate phosphatase